MRLSRLMGSMGFPPRSVSTALGSPNSLYPGLWATSAFSFFIAAVRSWSIRPRMLVMNLLSCSAMMRSRLYFSASKPTLPPPPYASAPQEDPGKSPDRRLQEDRFSTIDTLRHVVRETGCYHAGQTRHERKLTKNQNRGNRYRVDA